VGNRRFDRLSAKRYIKELEGYDNLKAKVIFICIFLILLKRQINIIHNYYRQSNKNLLHLVDKPYENQVIMNNRFYFSRMPLLKMDRMRSSFNHKYKLFL